MSINAIEYTVDLHSITPSTEQFAGVQGDHNITQIKFVLSEDFFNKIVSETQGKLMYRFDIYNGEGGLWQSAPTELVKEMCIKLEERHTRFGGKITIYLVITAVTEQSETEMELYSFPASLCLKNRANGTCQEGGNNESLTSLVESAKDSLKSVQEYDFNLKTLTNEIETKLKNGEYDGVGIQGIKIINDELIVSYTDNTSHNLGNIKGAQGEKGEKGDTGEKGKDAVIDQSYNGTSVNAQSGKAVAEAVNKKIPKVFTEGAPYRSITVLEGYNDSIPSDNAYYSVWLEDYDNNRDMAGFIPCRNDNGNLTTNTPFRDLECANKRYVDDLVGDIETLLGGI